MFYLPAIYPGFSWDNLTQQPPGTSKIPRLGGDFLWRQFYAAANLGVDMAYVGMFDEVDEGTAIFKVSNTPPTQGYFVTYDGFRRIGICASRPKAQKFSPAKVPTRRTFRFHRDG